MPQAKRGGSSSSAGGSRSGSTRRSASASSRGGGRTGSGSRPTKSSQARARSAASAESAQESAAGTVDPRIEAIAERVRKLNERIIEAGKGAGEVTLSSYEKALKSIASTLERGPGSSDVEWISNLATAQAKFIRDVTTAWTSAARDMLK
jgi:hypothetical protein